MGSPRERVFGGIQRIKEDQEQKKGGIQTQGPPKMRERKAKPIGEGENITQ